MRLVSKELGATEVMILLLFWASRLTGFVDLATIQHVFPRRSIHPDMRIKCGSIFQRQNVSLPRDRKRTSVWRLGMDASSKHIGVA